MLKRNSVITVSANVSSIDSESDFCNGFKAKMIIKFESDKVSMKIRRHQHKQPIHANQREIIACNSCKM